jgi:hypothetical protein
MLRTILDTPPQAAQENALRTKSRVSELFAFNVTEQKSGAFDIPTLSRR